MTNATAELRPAEGPQQASAKTVHGIRRHFRRLLAHVASRAPARVFALEGMDPPGAIDRLRLRSGIELVDTPRSATVLLVAGRIPAPMHEAARRAHDAMAHPRGVLQWVGREPADSAPFPNAAQERFVASDGDPIAVLAAAIHALQVSLLVGERTSSAALLPDADPAPWRGVGPYGQGGTGMTGGVPYGRPMAGRAPDRDGLELDQLPVRVGPFFAPFPAGLVLDIKLQGDVVQEVVVPGNGFAAPSSSSDVGQPETGRDHDPFRIATVHGIPVVELERARARHHLRWLAHTLRVHGLGALGCRCLKLAEAVDSADLTRVAGQVRSLRRFLERSRSLGWATSRAGAIDPSQIAGLALGPVSRAAGIAVDARANDPAYRELGFRTCVQSPGKHGSDARDRWRQRMDEIVQSLDLAARAGDRHAGGPGSRVEGPQGTLAAAPGWRNPSAHLIEQLPDRVKGLEWGDMVTTIVSLDLDVRAAAPGMAPLAPLAKPAAPAHAHSMSGMPGALAHGAGHGAAAPPSPAP